jgi:uroporphyrinogen-III synthase
VVSEELASHGLRAAIAPAEGAYFMKPLISALAVELGKAAPRNSTNFVG